MTGFLFDLDGVVIDSETQYSEIWHYIDTLYPTGVENFERVIKGCTLSNILSTYFQTSDVESITNILYTEEAKMRYRYCKGAKDFLQKTRSLGIKTALVTSSDNYKMARLYEHIPDITNMFDVIITANDITHSKPHPEGYLLAAEKLNLNPKDCVVFEDSLQGLQAGKNAGCRIVAISSTLGHEKVASISNTVTELLGNLNPSDFI